MTIKVRVGVPIPNGRLLEAARERGYPVLLSANAFYRGIVPPGHPGRDFGEKRFRIPPPDRFHGMDVALDSAGYVAAAVHGDYQWSVEEYVDLAAAVPWTFWSSLDLCCEPQIADDPLLRRLRIAATAQLLGRCRQAAREREIPMPMPILQGWHAHEYAWCASLLPLDEWPDLVGVGSVCRRQVNGPDGILAILDALDAVLPPHVRVHLFGVKSTVLEKVADHPRVGSMDSMAWDFGARMDRRQGRDAERRASMDLMGYRIERMAEWADSQRAIAEEAGARREECEHAAAAAAAQRAALLERLAARGARPTSAQLDLFDEADRALEKALGEQDAARGGPLELFPASVFRRGPPESDGELALRAIARTYEGLLLDYQLDYADAVRHSQREAYAVQAILHNHGRRLTPECLDYLQEVVPDVHEALLDILAEERAANDEDLDGKPTPYQQPLMERQRA